MTLSDLATCSAYSFAKFEAYDDGRVKNLLCVHGLLPITFRGVAYNIPIACWVPLDYPKEPPLAYVVPTGDMLVRQSQDVDVSGLCKSEYLKNWASKPEVRRWGRRKSSSLNLIYIAIA